MDERRFNWLQIIVTALITGIVTIVAGMLLFWFQEREPSLTFSSAETIPFAGSEKTIGIYNLKLKNEGKKEVRDVVCVVRIPSSSIEQSKVYVNPANSHSEETKGDVYTLHLSGLNPTEEASIAVLASSTQPLANRPEIALRAAGVTGVEESSVDKKTESPLLIIPPIIGVLASLLLISPLNKKLIAFIFRARRSHSGDQRYILAYLCSIFQLKEEEVYYRSLVQQVEYWSESDRLSDKALESKDESGADRISKLLNRLLDYAAVESSSEAIINYNLARIAAAFDKPGKKGISCQSS